MPKINIFLGLAAVFLAIAFVLIFIRAAKLKRKKKNEQADITRREDFVIQEDEEDRSIRLKQAESRANRKILFESQMPRIIKLKKPLKMIPNAYYSNDKIFIAFFLGKDIVIQKEPDIDDMPYIKNVRDMYLISGNIYRLPEEVERYLPEIINTGEVVIFSKTDGKLIDEVRFDKWAFSAGPLAGGGGFGYYITDDAPFFKFNTWVS
ncbi:MAG: hypothetical protein RBS77_02900 [Candidatus Moranbacteria bacterium]|jgi:hypothetical protein|nr:hypothetical protein [Candidatus Moranbacteria bacterium]